MTCEEEREKAIKNELEDYESQLSVSVTVVKLHTKTGLVQSKPAPFSLTDLDSVITRLRKVANGDLYFDIFKEGEPDRRYAGRVINEQSFESIYEDCDLVDFTLGCGSEIMIGSLSKKNNMLTIVSKGHLGADLYNAVRKGRYFGEKFGTITKELAT